MTTPYPFQEQGVHRIQEFGGRALLADSMGLGKSLQSLLWMKRYLQQGPTIIVCPASLKYNWSNEAATHIRHRVHILDGRKPQDHYLKGNNRIYVINYDILKDWLDWLQELKPQLLILDECHYCTSTKAQRTNAVYKLSQDVPHVLALSGTPLTNRPIELWPILHILRPEWFPSMYAFAWKWCNPVKNAYGKWDFKGAKDLDKLHKRLSKYVMIRRRKEDVLDQLPPKARHVVPLALSKPKEYQHAVMDFLGWLEGKDPSRVRKAAKAEMVSKLSYLKQLAAELKLPSVIEWVDNYLTNTDSKIILFVVHRKIAQALHDHYHRTSVIVTGSVIGKKRQQAFDQFVRDPRTRILVGNIKAAGVGWNAKGAIDDATVEFPWAPGDLVQANERNSGIGRGMAGRTATSYFLVGQGTIDIDILKLLRRKWKVIDKVLDGGKDTDSFDIFTKVAQLTLKRNKNGTK